MTEGRIIIVVTTILTAAAAALSVSEQKPNMGFAGGEVSRFMAGREDVPMHRTAARTIANAVVGGIGFAAHVQLPQTRRILTHKQTAGRRGNLEPGWSTGNGIS